MIDDSRRITAHFRMSEAIGSDTADERGIDNIPTMAQVRHIVTASEGMEKIRDILGGKPISVSSWFRCPLLNEAVGGVPNSSHLQGWAVDFNCRSFGSVGEIWEAIEASGLMFDQLINEGGQWLHVSFDPKMRGQAFKVDNP